MTSTKAEFAQLDLGDAKMSIFESVRRQNFIDASSYLNTLAFYAAEEAEIQERLRDGSFDQATAASIHHMRAMSRWEEFQLRYTGGEDIAGLSQSLEDVVVAFETYRVECEKRSDEDYSPPLQLNDLIDTYVDYLNLISVAVLMHRGDLVPRVFSLIEGGDFDGGDAVIEELLKVFIPDRPALDHWLWDRPYRALLDAIDADEPSSRAILMKKYVEGWCSSMKGKAIFWGKHQEIEPDYSPYHGYWAMCAGAFSYIYDIDDSSYRNEVVYPTDLVDYARTREVGQLGR